MNQANVEIERADRLIQVQQMFIRGESLDCFSKRGRTLLRHGKVQGKWDSMKKKAKMLLVLMTDLVVWGKYEALSGSYRFVNRLAIDGDLCLEEIPYTGKRYHFLLKGVVGEVSLEVVVDTEGEQRSWIKAIKDCIEQYTHG
eukprot:g82993.t1